MSTQRAPSSPPIVNLHIGTLKSGTSYLQNVLWRYRIKLADDGILFPGRDRWAEQVEAVRDLLREGKPTRRKIEVGAWDKMRDEILAWPGSVAIMSMELLSLATPDRVERIVSSFQPAVINAVITVRDLARVIPSSWQESVQNRQTWSWEEFVEGLTGSTTDDSRPAQRFWKQQDVPGFGRTWADLIGADHVHIVTVPRAGAPRDELWNRFAPVVGIDPVTYPAPGNVRGNPAVGAGSAEFLRRLNVQLGKKFDIATYERNVKHHLAKNTFAPLEDEERLHLPAQHVDWTRTRALEITAGIRALGLPVHGDLDELVPEPPPDRPEVTISESRVAAAGVQAVEALVRALADPTPGEEPQRLRAQPTDDDRRRRRARRNARRGEGRRSRDA